MSAEPAHVRDGALPPLMRRLGRQGFTPDAFDKCYRVW